jgi:hypothetical protein
VGVAEFAAGAFEPPGGRGGLERLWVPRRGQPTPQDAVRGELAGEHVGREVKDYLNEHEHGGGHAPNFHRPVSSYINETIQLGCTLLEIVEPQLRHDEIESPEQEIFTRIPNYIVIAARRDS